MIDTTIMHIVVGVQRRAGAITQSMSHVMAERVQSSHIPSVSARPAMESDECYESVSSPGAEQEEPYCPPIHNLEPEKEFILQYQSLPQLWDTSDIRYSNRFERYQALAKLLPIYQKMKPYGTIDDIKKKINSLRSNFRRELKKYMAHDNPGGYYPKVWYFPYLSFLRKLEGCDDKGESTPKVDETEKPEHIQIERPKEKKESLLRSLCTEPKPRSSHPPQKMKKKILHREQIRTHHRPQPYQHQHQCQRISNPLAIEWSETLARLDPLQKLYAKKAINDVLFEAELGNLHKNSVRINDDTPETYSTPQSDPISVQNDSTTEQDYKYPIAYLHCNLENDGQSPKETIYGD
ncbi:uncharacterized protein LOC123869450 [Maniola jurtina]|uniref:uncharacterized protein LOC123869450 n=1 Tax=Maniola jurtina TaxID=191418 RepID=UPI001E68B7E1|nr:uncharacterized protein LOC123869450 [Maniola jurtina]